MTNIKLVKDRLRKNYREKRLSFRPEQKEQYDRDILKNVISLYQYKNSSLVLTYVSKDIEVDTLKLIKKALEDGKQVAVPKCIDGTRSMEFYYITGFDMLESGTFGVLEPMTDVCKRVEEFKNSMCIVPGMAFDSDGYRLGYGKGYYDRFLLNYEGAAVGLCYSCCVKWSLPRGRFDKAVDVLVTESFFRKIHKMSH